MKNELTQIIEQEQIIPTQAEVLMSIFNPVFEKMKEYEIKANNIVVSDVSQIEEMRKAREIRLEVARLRIDADKDRKKLKENSLREGRAIQAVYNIIEALANPIEKHLEQQENFAKIIEEQKKLELLMQRSKLLSKFVLDTSLYNLQEMSEAGFQELLNASKLAYEVKLKEEKEAEEEKLRIEEQQRKENERIRIENEKLKKEAEEREKLLAKERKEQQDKIDLAKKQAKEAQDKLDKERKEKEEKEANERKLAQEKIDKENEEKRQLQLAPDKEKLTNLISTLNNLEYPTVESEKANQIISQVKDLIGKVSIYILKNSKEL